MAMATEAEFVTAPSTPELLPAHQPMAPAADPPAAAQPAQADSLEIVVEQRLRQYGGGSSSTMTIFRVPAHVRDANKELYEPRLVSIGPYYRGQPALRAMEQHKWRYLHELLAHYPSASLSGCVRAVREVAHRARRCYSERTDIFGAGDEFAEMLLLDGCFVLQFFTKWYGREPDKLCDVGWGLPLLLSDLLLLENQVPLFVLEALFHAVNPVATMLGLLMLVVPHFKLDGSAFCEQVLAGALPAQTELEIHHLLHLLYKAYVPRAEDLVSPPLPQSCEAPHLRLLQSWWLGFKAAVSERFACFVRAQGWRRLSSSMAPLRKVSAKVAMAVTIIGVRTQTEPPPAEPDRSTAPPPPLVVPSVTLLREAGVRFEKAASPRHMFDVTFDASRGVLSMPRLKVDYATKAQLVNLIAFEQTACSSVSPRGEAKLLSSYAALLGSLVKTGGDVEHLQRRGVAENLLGTHDDAAAGFFQQLGDCSSLDYGDHHFAGVFADLSRYYHSSWRRHRAKFLRDHCSSPWAVLALVVAGCAFCFALFKFSTTIYGLAHPYCHC
ncbi:unnamed protein product [Urochloa humidicola]